MNKIIKLIFTLSLLLTLSFGLIGCKSNDESSANNNDDLAKIDSKIEDKFNGNYVTSHDDIYEAVSYINENIDNVNDKENIRQLYEHASFLVHASNLGDVDDSNKIKEMATLTKEYASNLYLANEDTFNQIVEDNKEKIDNFKNDFTNGIDSFVDGFMEFF